jgi:hypothetical protein
MPVPGIYVGGLMADPLLSILVCGLYERGLIYHSDEGPIYELTKQAEGKPVQLITLYDNRVWTVGQKRNRLLWMAEGEYLTFVDDDDEVAGDYVDTLLGAIDKARGADVICFRQTCHHADTGLVEECRYGLGLRYESGPMAGKPGRCAKCGGLPLTAFTREDGSIVCSGPLMGDRCMPEHRWWTGLPAHTMAWRTALVQDDTAFPDGSFGEDVGWVQQACGLAKTEYQIDKTLYTYRFDPEKSRTRGR